MKKSKSSNKPQADFKNKPFTSLKGLVSAPVVPAKKSVAPRVLKNTHSNTEDDATLFLRSVEGAKSFSNAPDSHEVSVTRQGRERITVRAKEDNRLFLMAMKKIGTKAGDILPEREVEDTAQRSPSSRMRQLKRGTIHIGRHLDLHGFLKDEALMRLERFVADAYNGGQEAVLVITGKGINSPEGPVLQTAVADWLRKKGKGQVAEFSPAPRDRGGSGAFVVFLKKRRV